MAQSKISNPQSSEMTGMSNNSIFFEAVENPAESYQTSGVTLCPTPRLGQWSHPPKLSPTVISSLITVGLYCYLGLPSNN